LGDVVMTNVSFLGILKDKLNRNNLTPEARSLPPLSYPAHVSESVGGR
jgi:hypothetical protein